MDFTSAAFECLPCSTQSPCVHPYARVRMHTRVQGQAENCTKLFVTWSFLECGSTIHVGEHLLYIDPQNTLNILKATPMR